MNSNIQDSNHFHKNNEQAKMRAALTSIAQELQRFRTSRVILTTNEDFNEEIFKTINMVKSKLGLKRKQIKKLRKDLKTACIVAKTVMSAKESESYILTNHIQFARNQRDRLVQKNILHFKHMEEENLENQHLREKMKAIEAFITLGYNELQKMRNLPVQDISIIQQLKEIMICCGKYYADYYNEHEKIMQLEHRNRFLNHKIKIVTSNLKAVTENLYSIRQQNLKPKKNATVKGQQTKIESCINYAHSSYYVDHKRLQNKYNEALDIKCKPPYRPQVQTFDFNSHLSLVKTLLDNQDDMLKDLKKISLELR